MLFDVFDEEGRFLGPVDVPSAIRSLYEAFIRGDTFIAAVEDEAGTVMVKRYRIVLPASAPD